MNGEMSTTKGKIWEEKNSIEPEKKLENSGEFVGCDITPYINKKSENKILKDTTKISGIYKIINKINSKYYVGSSDDILSSRGRFYSHTKLLKRNKHYNKYLQRSWNKYGESNFDFIIIEETQNENLLIVEQKYLNIAKNEKNKCYNLCFDSMAPMKNRNHTIITKIKLKKSHLGKRNFMYGKHHRKDSIEKIRIARKNQIFTKEHKQNQINARIKKEIYTFFNKNTNEYFIGTQYEFKKLTKINPYFLLKKIRICYCGWMLK